MSVKRKTAVGLMISIVLVGFFLVLWKIAGRPTSNQGKTSNMAAQAARKSDDVSSAIKRPVKGASDEDISDEDVEKFIAFLDGLDKAQNSSQDDDSQNTLAAGDETPLSYEEELRQRLIRIKKTPEWKALQAEQGELEIRSKSVKTPESFAMAFMEFDLNPYSALGIATREEGEEMAIRGEISKQDWQYIKEVRQQFRAKNEEYYAKQVAIMRAVDELHGRKLELLGMTHREFCIAIGVPYAPRLSYYLPPLPSD